MNKLNPLHTARILGGEDPATLDLSKGTGKTTAQALEFLADTIRRPNVLNSAMEMTNDYHEATTLCRRALAMAKQIGLQHIHSAEGRKHCLIFEYRKPASTANTPPPSTTSEDDWS